jgi:cellulose synthase/poly-beta-1,6-N-acetylglucosamine synthase-like glycosyltransferase
VSVIVPVHAGGGALARCLQAVHSALLPGDELLVVLDGGDLEDRACALAHGAKVVEQVPRRGPAAARNRGVRHARGEILLFVDADVALHADAVQRVRDRFAGPDAPAALIGSYDDSPADPGFLSQYRNLLHHYVHQHGKQQAFTFWGGCGAIRRSVFLEVGGFDERHPRPSIEDIELGDRLRRAGHRIELDPKLQGTHLKRWTVRRMLRTDLCDRAIPWTRLILERGLPPADLALSWRQRLAAAFTCVGVASLLSAPANPVATPIAAASLATSVWVQRDLLRFFARRRGPRFALACVPWLWTYDLVSVLGALAGSALHLAARGRGPRQVQPA